MLTWYANKSHLSSLCCVGFYGGFWGHLSLAYASSALPEWPHGSFMENILLRQVTLLPSWKISFWYKSTQLHTPVLDVPWCLLGRVLLCNSSQSAGYQKVNCLLAIPQQKHVASWSTFKSGIIQPTTGCLYSCCISSASAD